MRGATQSPPQTARHIIKAERMITPIHVATIVLSTQLEEGAQCTQSLTRFCDVATTVA